MRKCLLLFLLVSGVCAADLTVISTWDSGPIPQGNVGSGSTLSVRGNRRRIERRSMMGGISKTSIELTWGDRGKKATLDPVLKVFVIEPMGPVLPGLRAMDHVSVPSSHPHRQATLTTECKVQSLGHERVSEWDTTHYRMTIRTRLGQSGRNQSYSSVQELWVADIPTFPFTEEMLPTRDFVDEDCRVKVTARGDVTRAQYIFSHLIVQQLSGLQERDPRFRGRKTLLVQQLLRTPLAPDLFEVPKDYRQVSPAEWNRLHHG